MTALHKNFGLKAAFSHERDTGAQAASKREHTRSKSAWIFGSRLRTWKVIAFTGWCKVVPQAIESQFIDHRNSQLC
jgi:hypothetical protein